MDEMIIPLCLCCSNKIDYGLYIKSGKKRKFCSKKCAVEYRTIEAAKRSNKGCLYCGSIFKAKSVKKTKYCSKSCCIKDKKAKPRKCKFCRIEFSPIRWSKTKNRMTSDNANKREYCSNICRHSGSKVNREKSCVSCSVLFTPIRMDRIANKYIPYDIPTTCSKECNRNAYPFSAERKKIQSIRYSGSGHPNWQGGSHKAGFRGGDWLKIAEKARIRAGRLCENCSKTEKDNGRKLDVHHKIPFHQFKNKEMSNEPSNLEALCKSCHQKADWKWRQENQVQLIMNFK